MASTNQNEVFKEPLKTVWSLTDTEFDALTTVLASGDSFSSKRQLRKAAQQAVPEKDADEISNVVEFAVSFAVATYADPLSKAEEFARRLADESLFLDLDTSETEKFARRLAQIFDAPGILTLAAVSDMARNQTNLTIGTRMLANFRSAGTPEPGKQPVVVPWYALRMFYRADGGASEEEVIEFAMDAYDIKHLRDQLNDLIKSQAATQQEYRANGLRVWDQLREEKSEDD